MTTNIEALQERFQSAMRTSIATRAAFMADRMNGLLRAAADKADAATALALAAVELARYQAAIDARVEAQAALARNPTCRVLQAMADDAFEAMEAASRAYNSLDRAA